MSARLTLARQSLASRARAKLENDFAEHDNAHSRTEENARTNVTAIGRTGRNDGTNDSAARNGQHVSVSRLVAADSASSRRVTCDSARNSWETAFGHVFGSLKSRRRGDERPSRKQTATNTYGYSRTSTLGRSIDRPVWSLRASDRPDCGPTRRHCWIRFNKRSRMPRQNPRRLNAVSPDRLRARGRAVQAGRARAIRANANG
jgi:hypothetical protein